MWPLLCRICLVPDNHDHNDDDGDHDDDDDDDEDGDLSHKVCR